MSHTLSSRHIAHFPWKVITMCVTCNLNQHRFPITLPSLSLESEKVKKVSNVKQSADEKMLHSLVFIDRIAAACMAEWSKATDS